MPSPASFGQTNDVNKYSAPKKLKQPYGLAAAATVLLLITVTLGATLGIKTQARFSEVESSWASYSSGAERQGALISELRGFLGYGGIIHNFKNFVLRQDDIYLVETLEQLDQFQAVMDDLEELELSQNERNAVNAIETTIAQYEANLVVARQAAAEGWSISRTDQLVRIDDAEALNALGVLESEWRVLQESSTARMLSSVSEGRRLIWIGYWSIAALMLAAVTIGILVYFLVHNLQSELHKRQKLQRSQARLATIAEQSPATILMTDTDARIIYVNRKFKDLTGWDDQDILGKTPAFLQSGATTDSEYTDIRKHLERGASWHGVFRNLCKDGSSYWAETSIIPLRGPEGQIQNYVGIGQDITETRRARDQVVRAQKLEAVGQLAGGVAHDFNNILTTIVGASHLAALDATEGSDLANEIDQIGIAARRAQHLVRELLTFARREPAVPQPVVLADAAEEVISLLRASMPPVIDLRLEPSSARLTVLGDATHLHQIIMNLCRNAAEAMAGSPGTIVVRITNADDEADVDESHEGFVRLDVQDDGPGMSEQTLAHLFEPFFTTKPIGKGSGLGLAVVYGLVEDMGGSIHVESVPGEGSTFTVMMPATSLDAATVSDLSGHLPRGNERILLVDDQIEVANTLRRQLMRLGYQVDAFNAPLLALERFRKTPETYDLLVTDMVMPDMNGQDLAEAMRLMRENMPVLICSAYRLDGIQLSGRAPALMQKPIDPALFARQVRTALSDTSQ